MFLEKRSVTEIFPTCNGESYVLDGTNCNSFGILKIKLESLSFEIALKPRLKFRDRNGNFFNISWTSEESLRKYKDLAPKTREVLVILGKDIISYIF